MHQDFKQNNSPLITPKLVCPQKHFDGFLVSSEGQILHPDKVRTDLLKANKIPLIEK